MNTRIIFMICFVFIVCIILNGCNDSANNVNKNKEAGYSAEAIKKADALVQKYGGINGEYGSRPIHDAVMSGDIELVKLLIERGADVNSMMPNERWTPLYIACNKDLYDIAVLLFSNGAKVKLKDEKGAGPIHMAHSIKMIELLIKHGADINEKNFTGNTPLHLAARSEDKEWVEALIEKGADINALNNNGATPLDFADISEEIVKLLIKHGAIHGKKEKGIQEKDSKEKKDAK